MLSLPSLRFLFTRSAYLEAAPDGKWFLFLNGRRIVGEDGDGLELEVIDVLLEKVELEAQGLVERIN